MNPSNSNNPPAPPSGPTWVRYSLPELLLEVQQERQAMAFAMEKLDQAEIGKLFSKNKPTRRVLKNK